jgi:glycogen synthase
MGEIDKRNRFEEDVFSYSATQDGRVFLFWHGRQIRILQGSDARIFLQDIIHVDDRGAQLIIARMAGNFRRGNER